MQVTDKIRKFWSDLNEKGDGIELARITGLDDTTISKILSGKKTEVSTDTVLKINSFYKERKQKVLKAKKII
jgi:DNA-binding Xre family transcriptional regulator